MDHNSYYQYLQQHLTAGFHMVRVLKEETGTRILLLRHRVSKEFFVLRSFDGTAEIYRKLMTVASVNLPRIYEVAEENGRLLVLEEYIQGDTLDSILEQGGLPRGEVRRIALQLCNALHVLHGFGAVHRDVKPENIILRGSEAVLIDFDASRIQKPEQTSDTVILGTVGYAAPEQYGLSQTDQRADIYSLGVLINVMLTGEHPSVRLARGHLGHVIRRCTMTNPDERYRNISDVAENI
ncbi:MAG: serine/threonine protein kinase [Oscillospiraceae bacterium]|nr:serine/threonine protein kinase [Oscillospiraceae bacterium]